MIEVSLYKNYLIIDGAVGEKIDNGIINMNSQGAIASLAACRFTSEAKAKIIERSQVENPKDENHIILNNSEYHEDKIFGWTGQVRAILRTNDMMMDQDSFDRSMFDEMLVDDNIKTDPDALAFLKKEMVNIEAEATKLEAEEE